MKKIDELISRLQEAKEELLKNQNMSYSGATNSAAPASMDKKEGREHDDSNDKEPELKGPEKGGAKRDQPKIEKGEYLKLFKNGQWDIEKAMTADDIRAGMAGARGGGAGYKPAVIAKPIGKAEGIAASPAAPAAVAKPAGMKPTNVARPDKGFGAIIAKDEESPTKC